MNYQPRFSTEAEAFKSCFSGVASFLGRPSAPTVLFSGDPHRPERDHLRRSRARSPNRVGIEAKVFTRADFERHRVELPAIVFLADRPPVACFRRRAAVEFLTVPQDGGRTSFSRKELTRGTDHRHCRLLADLYQCGRGSAGRLGVDDRQAALADGNPGAVLAILCPRRFGRVLHQPDRAGVAAFHDERLRPDLAEQGGLVALGARDRRFHLDPFRSFAEDGPRRR